MPTVQTTPDIAIIIPFFQREPGLLNQCVQSILEQAGDVRFKIVVVDDESPVRADQDLADLVAGRSDTLQIIRQMNGGPGSARNTGLDNVPVGTPYVAFLDSDDQWVGPFLQDSISTLEQGYDLFVGNTSRTGLKGTRFEWDANADLNITSDNHRLIDRGRETYEYQGDFFNLLVRRSSIISTTALAYRFDRFPNVRFNPTIYNGQDRLFKLTLGQNLGKVAFSPKVYAHEGEGINIFDKSQWGTAGSIRFLSSYIKLSKCILEQIRLNSDQRSYVQTQLADSRRSLALSVPHLMRRGVPVDWRKLFATFREDPATAALFLPNVLRGLLGRVSGKS